MSKPILVGYDAATADPAPVHFGIAAARCTGASVIVACARADEDAAAGDAQSLDELREAFAGEDVALDIRELAGASAARALHEAAEEADAGLLVVGSSRRGALGRVLPGSTAERLMHGAPCPLAVVPRGWERGRGLRSIGVAYVDSDEAREALKGAYALASRSGATLRVLTVVTPGLGVFGETAPRIGVTSGTTVVDAEGEYLAAAERAARAAVAEVDGKVGVEVDAFLEDPAQTLIRASENLDLLVCGSRGYGPLRAVLLGGVSRRVAADAHCPVIVLPRGVSAPLADLIAEQPASA